MIGDSSPTVAHSDNSGVFRVVCCWIVFWSHFYAGLIERPAGSNDRSDCGRRMHGGNVELAGKSSQRFGKSPRETVSR
jgi:hypothetical protein